MMTKNQFGQSLYLIIRAGKNILIKIGKYRKKYTRKIGKIYEKIYE